MNKLFSKIAALSVGLAMAVGVGVALGRQDVKEAKAASGSVTIDYTTVDDRVEGYSDSQMSYAHTTDGYTATITAVKNDGTKVTNYYPGTAEKTYNTTRFYAKNGLSFSVLNSSSAAMYITKIEVTSTSSNYADAMKGATWTGVKSTSKSGSGTAWLTTITPNSNVKDVSCVLSATTNATNVKVYWSDEAVVDPEINVQESTRVGVGMSVEVSVAYVNLTSAITVSATSEVSVPSSLSVSGSGNTTLTISGVTATASVEVTLTSGTAEATISVEVVNPTEFHLLTDLSVLTPGSQFTFVSLYEEEYYYPSTFVEGYYLSSSTSIVVDDDDKSFKSIDATVFTFDSFDEMGAYIKDGDYYVGSKNFTGASITRNTDVSKVTNSHWDIKNITDEIATVVLTGADSGNINLRYNGSAGRFSNYSTACNISIYVSYLAPALYATDSIRISTSESHNAFVTAVNFGGETITYNVSVEDESVATAVWSTDHAVITPVAAGNTTVTISAQSTNHGPVEVNIPLEVYDATRDLESITLSVAEETLYKGQEFSYSGTVTANYSNGDHETVLNPTFTGQDMSAVGDYEVTVSYTDAGVTKTATYTLHVVSWTGVLSLNKYYVLAAMKTVDEVAYLYTMVGLNKSGTNHYGVAAENVEMLSRTESALYVEEGATYNSYAFRLGNGKYLGINKDANTLTDLDEINESSSFTVGAIGETGYSITNVAYSDRSIKFNPGTSTTAPRFSTYTSGQIDVNLFQVTSTDIASHFEANFMHIEIPTDNHEDTGKCRGEEGYYALAKAAFNVMPLESRQHFLANSNYASRLEAWAIANGDEINTDSQLVSSTSELFFSSKDVNNNSYIIIIVISSVSVLSFGLALFLRKKRSK